MRGGPSVDRVSTPQVPTGERRSTSGRSGGSTHSGGHAPDRHTSGGVLCRALVTIGGGAVCLAGIALLVLPGPGLLVVLGGLVLLANEYPWARRLIAPVRRQATHAAQHSVSSPTRIAGSVLCGVALSGAGIAWMLVPSLPFAGVATSSTLVLSGGLLLALLGYSYRHFARRPQQ